MSAVAHSEIVDLHVWREHLQVVCMRLRRRVEVDLQTRINFVIDERHLADRLETGN